MKIFLVTIEFISALLLIIAVLLHSAKGEGLGAIGGSAKIFTTQQGLESGLDKLTTILSIVFVVSALLYYLIS